MVFDDIAAFEEGQTWNMGEFDLELRNILLSIF